MPNISHGEAVIETIKYMTDHTTHLENFDPSLFLDNDETIAAFLQSAIEDGDVSLIASALGAVAKARGMSSIAQQAGLTRESLYKALRSDAQPRFDTILRVLTALGLQMKIIPTKKKRVTTKLQNEHAHA